MHQINPFGRLDCVKFIALWHAEGGRRLKFCTYCCVTNVLTMDLLRFAVSNALWNLFLCTSIKCCWIFHSLLEQEHSLSLKNEQCLFRFRLHFFHRVIIFQMDKMLIEIDEKSRGKQSGYVHNRWFFCLCFASWCSRLHSANVNLFETFKRIQKHSIHLHTDRKWYAPNRSDSLFFLVSILIFSHLYLFLLCFAWTFIMFTVYESHSYYSNCCEFPWVARSHLVSGSCILYK